MPTSDIQALLQGTLAFGPWLKQARTAADLTREEFSEHIGCSSSAIYKMETGLQRPSKQMALLIARYFAIAEADQDRFIQQARLNKPTESGSSLESDSVGDPVENPNVALLPVPLTSFVGRETELATLQRMLENPLNRLISVVGTGGVGKTRLVLEALQAYQAGCCFVSLVSLQEPAQVTPAIARSLGITESRQPALELLKQELAPREMLLILDNFEHLLPAADVVLELLAAAPRLQILVTSRTWLRLSGEHVLSLNPLPLPEQSDVPYAENPAIQLFVQRAQALEPTWTLTADNQALVADICRRLEGIPLAIELAAARLRLLPLEALSHRLESRLQVLNHGMHDLPERQQSLRATIQWSYDLLDAPAQAAARYVSLFPGGCRLAAVEALAATQDTIQTAWAALNPAQAPPRELVPTARAIIEQIETLLDYHLIARQRDFDGEPRFTMLESLREWMREELRTAQIELAVLQRYAAYYQGLTMLAVAGVLGPEQRRWLELVEAEHANIQACLAWLLETQQPERACSIAAHLGRFWSIHGHSSIGRSWLERALDLEQHPSLAQVQALNAAGSLACDQGDYIHARDLVEQAYELAVVLNDQLGQAEALKNLGIIDRSVGEYISAHGHLEASLALFESHSDLQGQAGVLNNLGIVAKAQQSESQAVEYYQQSLSFFRQLQHYGGMAMVLNNLGVVAKNQANYAQAHELYREALSLFQQLADRRGSALAFSNLGVIAAQQQQIVAATEYYTQALELFREAGDRLGIANILSRLAELKTTQGLYQQAWKLYRDSLQLCWQLGVKHGLLAVLEGMLETAESFGASAAVRQLKVAVQQLTAASNLQQPAIQQSIDYLLTISLDP